MPAPIYTLPPIRFESPPLSAQQLAERVDWGLRAHGIPDHWQQTQGEGVRVAVLDTGSSDHDDLPEPIFAHDFTGRSPADRNGHSTHCAGIIGARANDRGVVGVAPKCQLGYCKVLSDGGSGSTIGIARGIKKAIEERCNIISMSLGGGYSQDIERACQAADDAGVFVISAAGNSGYAGRNTIDYPGKLKETICVAAYNARGEIANFSSGGEELDITAPGENIYSTYPGNSYRGMSGTSMATPFVAGVVALMLSAYADDQVSLANVTELRAALKEHVTDKGPTGPDNRWGPGIPRVEDLIDLVDDEDRQEDPFYWL